MDAPLSDLAYLERFCKGDRARMEKYIRIYLAGAPELFAKMDAALAAQPQLHYLWLARLLPKALAQWPGWISARATTARDDTGRNVNGTPAE